MGEEKFYKKVEDELNGKPRKYTDRALMTKAEVLSEGDSEKARYKYIQLRVEQLKEKEHRKIEKEKELIEQEKANQKEQEKIIIDSKKATTRNWILFGAFIIAFATGKIIGLLGAISLGVGVFVFLELNKTKSMLLSISVSIFSILAIYFLGILLSLFIFA